MDTTSFAFGSIALIGQLATASLSAYGLLQDAKSTGEDATHFHFLVTAQMTILSLWVKTWVQPEALGDSGGKLLDGVSARIGEEGCLLVVRILAKISKTLSDAETLQTRYGICLSPTIAPPLAHPQGGLSSRSPTLNNAQACIPQSLTPKPDSPLGTAKTVRGDSKLEPPGKISSRRMNGHGLRAFLTRTGRKLTVLFRRHNKHHAREPIAKQPAEPQTIPSNTSHATASSPTPKLDAQLMDIGRSLSLLEQTKTEILNNLSKVQCLKWALFDKEKGLELARELEYWNDTLFKILPLKPVDPPETADPPG